MSRYFLNILYIITDTVQIYINKRVYINFIQNIIYSISAMLQHIQTQYSLFMA